MSTPILATKLYIPPPRPRVVLRPRLIERLDEGLSRRLTLISAPAGFGKTMLVSEWIAACARRTPKICVAWLSLDEADNDPARFLTGLVAALQTIAPNSGDEVLRVLQATPPPSTESLLTILLNELTPRSDHFILVLDDYHAIEAKPLHDALTFLIEHQPPPMHLVIATREDPPLPLAQLRVRDQLTELRAADLRFTFSEAADFLNQVMRLQLAEQDIAALETRTEGWIAGLQLAAISMQGLDDATRFIQSFTGSHRFVMDYLVEQVLGQQSENIQTFLLHTSILDRMCGSLCDAVLGTDEKKTESSSFILDFLERANLFIVPLDNERRWYRYHHLFADLLRQRLQQSAFDVAELHKRAGIWYEENGLEIEAFQHATAANDVARAEYLIEGKGMPLHFRGAVVPVLNWLKSQPTTVLDAYPSLWTTYASVLLVSGHETGVEQKLQSAEAALSNAESNDKNRDILGRVAAIRATLAINHYDTQTVIAQSKRALEYLHPSNLAFRTFTIWKLGYAYHIQGDRAAARRAYTEAISISQASKNTITTLTATIGLGFVQETDNQLDLSAETYRRALQLLGDQILPVAFGAHLGLARIAYEWNDLQAAEQHYQQGVQFARHSENADRSIVCEIFHARLKLAQGDVSGAAAILAQADQAAHQSKLALRLPEVAAIKVLTLLRQGDVATATHLAQTHNLPISQARVLLAQGDASAALAILEPFRQQMEAKHWEDERLKAMVLQSLALYLHGDKDRAMQALGDTLALAEPSGMIRLFVDEGERMRLLISDFQHLPLRAMQGFSIVKTAPHLRAYLEKILAAFPAAPSENQKHVLSEAEGSKIENLLDPLSARELEVLRLIAQGLSNREIGERLYLALSTVKGHSRIIFDKLQVRNRTEAVVRGRELGLL